MAVDGFVLSNGTASESLYIVHPTETYDYLKANHNIQEGLQRVNGSTWVCKNGGNENGELFI